MFNFDKKKSEILFLKVDEKNLTKNSPANPPRKDAHEVFGARVDPRLRTRNFAAYPRHRVEVAEHLKMQEPPQRAEIF